MALVKCPDCEKMVSSRAKECPNCACPAEYFLSENENELVEQESIIFSIAKDFPELKYTNNTNQFALLFGEFWEKALAYSDSLLKIYDDSGNIVTALSKVPRKASDYINETIEKIRTIMYENNIVISSEEIQQKHYSTYGEQYEGNYYDVLDRYEDILELDDKLSAKRAEEKAGRLRWQGGGFGLKGAIKGVATATILNIGSDVLHSFGDNANENSDKRIVADKLRNLYFDKNVRYELCDSFKETIYEYFCITANILFDNGIIENVIPVDYRKAIDTYNSIMSYEKDNMVRAKKMIDCIQLFPGEIEFYRPVVPFIIMGDNQFDEFIEFWNFKTLLLEIQKEKEGYALLEKKNDKYDIDKFNYDDFDVSNVALGLKYLQDSKHLINDIRNENLLKQKEYILRAWNYNPSIFSSKMLTDNVIGNDALGYFENAKYIAKICHIDIFDIFCDFSDSETLREMQFFNHSMENEKVLLFSRKSLAGVVLTNKQIWDLKTYKPVEVSKQIKVETHLVDDVWEIVLENKDSRLIFSNKKEQRNIEKELSDERIKAQFEFTANVISVIINKFLLAECSSQNISFDDEVIGINIGEQEELIDDEPDKLNDYLLKHGYDESFYKNLTVRNLFKLYKEIYDATYFESPTYIEGMYLSGGVIKDYLNLIGLNVYEKGMLYSEKFYDYAPNEYDFENYANFLREFINSLLISVSNMAIFCSSKGREAKVVPSLLGGENCLCTGVFIGLTWKKGYILTSRHLIDISTEQKIELNSIRKIEPKEDGEIVVSYSNKKCTIATGKYASGQNNLDNGMANSKVVSAYLNACVKKYKGCTTKDKNDKTLVDIKINSEKVKCFKCGKLINKNSKFCNFCGESNAQRLKECPDCGKEIKIDSKFCNFCGHSFM